MSWSDEEWKEGLPFVAIERITSMENSIEVLKKEVTQYKYKTENIDCHLSDTKKKLEEEIKEKNALERNITELTNKLDNEIDNCKKLKTNFSQKESIIDDLNERFVAIKTESDQKSLAIEKLQSQLEVLNSETSQSNLKAKGSATRLNEATIISNQRIEELTQRLSQYQKENRDLEVSYENKLRGSLIEQQRLSSENESLKRHAQQLETIKQANGDKKSEQVSISFHGEVLAQNKLLQEEIQSLRKLLADKNLVWCLDENNPAPYTPETMQVYPVVMKRDENTDSGLALRGQPTIEDCFRKEVILSRVEAKPDGDNEAFFDVDCPSSGPSTHRSSSTDSDVDTFKREVEKLKSENKEMRKVYEKHMRVCKKRSSTSFAACTDLEALNVDLKQQVQEKEEEKAQLEGHLMQEKMKNLTLQKEAKVDDFKMIEMAVEKMLRKNREEDSKTLSSIIQQFNGDITENFLRVQDSVQYAHSATRDKICAFFEKKARTPKSERRKDFYKNKGGEPGGCISELEVIKGELQQVQENMSSYGQDVRKLESERDHMQEELIKMVDVVQLKEEEIGRMKCMYESEKRKVVDNDSCFRREMDSLKTEQLEIYEEFRDMCDNLKKKDIALLNKTKELKLATSEWREKEDSLTEKISSLRDDYSKISSDKQRVQSELNNKQKENASLLRRLHNSVEQVSRLYDNLSRIDGMFQEAKKKGLYH